MSFNRRGPDRRPDRPPRDRFDRPPRRESGDWQPRERPGGERPGGERPYQPRGERPYQPRGERQYQPRGGDRPYDRRPRPDPRDEGAMSIRLDPRRLGTLKHLAGEAGVRPGDLVRQWVEERIDAARGGTEPAPGGESLSGRVAALAERVAALESAAGIETAPPPATTPAAEEEGTAERTAESKPEAGAPATKRPRRNAVAASPSERVALHDEMIAVLSERGPMTAAELASAISERGRYAPPRSGKALDAATVSQRVSNPTYRARFTRNEGRIGLAE